MKAMIPETHGSTHGAPNGQPNPIALALGAMGSSNPRGGSRGDADEGLALKYPTDTET